MALPGLIVRPVTRTFTVEGLAGLTVAREEGLEFHIMGSTVGIDFNDVALKFPAVGKMALLEHPIAPVAATAVNRE
jgi:hypothetical protein